MQNIFKWPEVRTKIKTFGPTLEHQMIFGFDFSVVL